MSAMAAAADKAAARVVLGGQAKWNRVTGLTGALVASLHTVGWYIRGGWGVRTDDQVVLDLRRW